MSNPYSRFWAGLQLSDPIKKYEHLMSTVIQFKPKSYKVRGFIDCKYGDVEGWLSGLGFQVFACTERAYKILDGIYVAYPWSLPGNDGFDIPDEVYHRGVYSYVYQPSGQNIGVTVAVYVTHEDQEEVEGWSSEKGWTGVKEVVKDSGPQWIKIKKPQPQLGSPEWPDDAVIQGDLGSDNLFFPDPSVNGYRHWKGKKLFNVNNIETGFGLKIESLTALLEWLNTRELPKGWPLGVGRYAILTPEQAFSRLGVFRDYLGPKYGLGGYGSTTPEDLMELRKKVYQGWVRQMFPHLFNKECPHKLFVRNAEGVAICETCGQVVEVQKQPMDKCSHKNNYVKAMGALCCRDCDESYGLGCDCEVCIENGGCDECDCHFDCDQCPISMLNREDSCSGCGKYHR